MASCHVGKTPEQVSRRYERTVDEVTACPQRSAGGDAVRVGRAGRRGRIAGGKGRGRGHGFSGRRGSARAAAENARVPAASSAADCEASELGAVKRKPEARGGTSP
jgi:hypothetical protein